MSDVMEVEARPDRASGGYTEVAAALTRHLGTPVSRQRVWMWWSRRARNDFPNGWVRQTYRGGGVRQFYVDEVLAWYEARYGESIVPAPRVGTS